MKCSVRPQPPPRAPNAPLRPRRPFRPSLLSALRAVWFGRAAAQINCNPWCVCAAAGGAAGLPVFLIGAPRGWVGRLRSAPKCGGARRGLRAPFFFFFFLFFYVASFSFSRSVRAFVAVVVCCLSSSRRCFGLAVAVCVGRRFRGGLRSVSWVCCGVALAVASRSVLFASLVRCASLASLSSLVAPVAVCRCRCLARGLSRCSFFVPRCRCCGAARLGWLFVALVVVVAALGWLVAVCRPPSRRCVACRRSRACLAFSGWGWWFRFLSWLCFRSCVSFRWWCALPLGCARLCRLAVVCFSGLCWSSCCLCSFWGRRPAAPPRN